MDACSRDLSCIGLGCSASPGKYDHCPVDKVGMGEGSRVNLEKGNWVERDGRDAFVRVRIP